MFATTTLRSRKSPSGISGARPLASIPTKIASSTAAAPSSPSVWTDVQPSWLPLTIA